MKLKFAQITAAWVAGCVIGGGVAVAQNTAESSTATRYAVSIEYCNGKGQVDGYSTIRSGVHAYAVRVRHGVAEVGSYSYVSLQRRVGSRPWFEVDHQNLHCS